MKKLAVLLLVMVAALALAFPAVAPGHAGPPSATWHQCKWLGIWTGNRTFTGSVYARANTATYYLVRIKPSWPFGWSGTVTANSQTHARILIPAFSAHWFQSAIVFTGYPSGTFGYRIFVSPNAGVFNSYSAEIWSPYRCS